MLIQKSKNVHVYKTSIKQSEPHLILIATDVHFDNPKCRRDILKKDLDEAMEKGARVIFPGDLFCLMQGKWDPRSSKTDLLPQHQVTHYLDAVIEEAAEWFAPYASIIDVVGYGNHETSISRRHETDVLARFVQLLNHNAGLDEHKVRTGAYGGWYVTSLTRGNTRTRRSYKMKYYHGSGGGAPVTKGTIQHNRMSTFVQGADCIVMGHVHNDYEVTYSVETLDAQHRIQKKDLLMIRSPTYKDEYFNLSKGPGTFGWHVERGAPPKPIGGRWLEINWMRRQLDNKEDNWLAARSYRTKNS
jgi:hypothetical protein